MNLKGSMGEFLIGGVPVGINHPCFIIAEIAQAHDGSLGTAHAYIDAVSKTGASAIKFQTHIAQAESTIHEKFRIHFSSQDKTRYDYWKRTAFTEDQWAELSRHAQEKNLIFLSSPFSSEAAALLERLGISAWKVGSGELNNLPMIEQLCATQKPVLFSSGMSVQGELDAAVECANRFNAPFGIFQCTSLYPCPPEKIGFNMLNEYRQTYKCPVGLSDHSGTIYPSIAATALGANFIEVHAVFSRECFGPDVISSVTTSELKQIVEGVRYIERSISNPIDKEILSDELSDIKKLFGKSIFAAYDLNQGRIIEYDDIVFKKPGFGIPAKNMHYVVGKRLIKSCKKDSYILEEDFE